MMALLEQSSGITLAAPDSMTDTPAQGEIIHLTPQTIARGRTNLQDGRPAMADKAV
jgi:hypothetical protein